MRLFLLFIVMATFANSSDYIDIFTSYTNGSRLFIKGRITDTKDKYNENSKTLSNFFNDEKKGITVHLSVDKVDYIAISDNEGYFDFDIHSRMKISSHINMSIYTKDKNSTRAIRPFQPSTKKHIGIISDFDDTVIVSNVTQKTKLLYNTFFTNYKNRKIVKQAKKTISEIVKSNKMKENTALFFITGSPHQLHHNINSFLDYHKFPPRTILSKKIHGQDKDNLRATIAYKYDKIAILINMYPQIKWVLLGDNGERDPQIYKKVLENYPNKVSAVYIRDALKNGTGKLTKMFP